MAEGQTNFTADLFGGGTEERKIYLPPPREWDSTFSAGGAQAMPASATNPDGVPWISSLKFKLQGSAPAEDAEDVTIYHSLFLSIEKDKHGNLPHKLKGAIQDLAYGLGVTAEELKQKLRVMEYTTKTNKTVRILDPQSVVSFLKENDGKNVRLVSENVEDRKSKQTWPKVKMFVAPEGFNPDAVTEAAAKGQEEPEEQPKKAAPSGSKRKR